MKFAGDARGARVPLEPQIRKLVAQKLLVGGLFDGDEVIVKIASDGTSITRQDVATVTTITSWVALCRFHRRNLRGDRVEDRFKHDSCQFPSF